MGDAINLAQFYLTEAARLSDGAKVSAEIERAEALRKWLVERWAGPDITVSARPGIAFSTLASEVMEQVPVRTTHLNKIVAANRKDGLVRFDLPTGKRTPNPETKLWPSGVVNGT